LKEAQALEEATAAVLFAEASDASDASGAWEEAGAAYTANASQVPFLATDVMNLHEATDLEEWRQQLLRHMLFLSSLGKDCEEQLAPSEPEQQDLHEIALSAGEPQSLQQAEDGSQSEPEEATTTPWTEVEMDCLQVEEPEEPQSQTWSVQVAFGTAEVTALEESSSTATVTAPGEPSGIAAVTVPAKPSGIAAVAASELPSGTAAVEASAEPSGTAEVTAPEEGTGAEEAQKGDQAGG